MKYKLKIDYIPREKSTQDFLKDGILRKGEVIEVVGYSEPVGEVVCFYMKGIQINIPLQTFLLVTEEYVEPQKRKTCPTCKHKEKCEELTKEWGIFLLGDTCMRYEESTEEEPND